LTIGEASRGDEHEFFCRKNIVRESFDEDPTAEGMPDNVLRLYADLLAELGDESSILFDIPDALWQFARAETRQIEADNAISGQLCGERIERMQRIAPAVEH